MLKGAASNRWIFFILGVLAVSVAGAGALEAAQSPTGEGKKSGWMSAEPRKTAPGDDNLRKLLVARYNAALAVVQAKEMELSTGRIEVVAALAEAARHLLDAELELADNPAEQLLAYERALEYARSVERMLEARREAGTATLADVERAHYHALDAEIQLLKARRKVDKAK
jgi:hypothetical protein